MSQKRYEFIISTLRKAGDLLLEKALEDIKVSSKNHDFRDKVTNVDKTLSNFISEIISQSFSGETIYSEEKSDVDVSSGSFWSIDPIDGTANFSRGIPHFAIVITYIEKGIPEAGGIYNPVTRELFSFQRGKGTFLNGQSVSVSSVTTLSYAHFILHIGRNSRLWDWGLKTYRFLLDHANKTINLGSSALDLCFVGAGRIEACIYGTFTTIDVGAAIGFVHEAGGLIVDGKGKEITTLSKNKQIVIAVNGLKLLSFLKNDIILPKEL